MTIRTVDEALLRRLRATEPMGMLSGCCDTVAPVNPDGPEAATLIEQLHNRVERLTEALAFYRDEWESEVDAEQTVHGWTGTIGDTIPTEALYRDRGHTARVALTGEHNG